MLNLRLVGSDSHSPSVSDPEFSSRTLQFAEDRLGNIGESLDFRLGDGESDRAGDDASVLDYHREDRLVHREPYGHTTGSK